jgi:general secretion pathway protein F
VQRGVIDAPTAGDVIARLQQQGSLPIRAEPQDVRSRSAPDWVSLARDRGGPQKHQVGNVLWDLNNALHDVQAVSTSPRVRRVLAAVRGAVRDGCSLSSAFDRHPASFGRLHIGLVRAGEAEGQLSAALSGLAELLETQRALAVAIQSALIYPALLLVALIGSVWLLLIFLQARAHRGLECPESCSPAPAGSLAQSGEAMSDSAVTTRKAML